MHASRNRLSRRVVRSVAALIIAGGLATAIHAGPPPNLLDDNRGNLELAATETAVFNLALTTAGFFGNPLTFTYPPVIIDGRVLHHPKIHNLYLDDDWDGHNPDAPTRAQLDALHQGPRLERLFRRRGPVRRRQRLVHGVARPQPALRTAAAHRR